MGDNQASELGTNIYRITRHPSPTGTRTVAKVRCGECPKEEEITLSKNLPPTVIEHKFAQSGWERQNRDGEVLCPKCITKRTEARRAKHKEEINAMFKTKTEPAPSQQPTNGDTQMGAVREITVKLALRKQPTTSVPHFFVSVADKDLRSIFNRGDIPMRCELRSFGKALYLHFGNNMTPGYKLRTEYNWRSFAIMTNKAVFEGIGKLPLKTSTFEWPAYVQHDETIRLAGTIQEIGDKLRELGRQAVGSAAAPTKAPKAPRPTKQPSTSPREPSKVTSGISVAKPASYSVDDGAVLREEMNNWLEWAEQEGWEPDLEITDEGRVRLTVKRDL